MSLFDQISCKVPLPVKKGIFGAKTAAEWKNHSFQTKDLDCAMFNYEIRRSGLWKQEHRRGWVKDHFTGEVRFYDFILNDGHKSDLWIEFGAGFKDGKLDGKVRQIEWRYEDNTKRKEREQKWGEERRRRLEFEGTKRYRFLYKYSNKASRLLFRGVFKALDWANYAARKLESWSRF